MQRLSCALVVLLLLTGPTAHASTSDRPKRFAVSLRAGTFDEQGSGVMLRKDGEPGNPVIGWLGSDQFAAALAFDVLPGLTLDLSYVELDYDFGSDLVMTAPDGEFVGTRIASGDMDEYRLSLVLDAEMLLDEPSYFVSPQRSTRWRFALVVAAAMTTVGDVDVTEAARGLLGIDGIDTGRQSSAGAGARFDYRLGRSAVTVGASVGWMWSLSGDLFTVNTMLESPYAGTAVDHEGLDFLMDLSYHF